MKDVAKQLIDAANVLKAAAAFVDANEIEAERLFKENGELENQLRISKASEKLDLLAEIERLTGRLSVETGTAGSYVVYCETLQKQLDSANRRIERLKAELKKSRRSLKNTIDRR